MTPVDVVVVGAGPGGLAAALAAGDAGCDVLLVDAAPAVGGQIYRQPAIAGAPPAGPPLPRRLRRVVTHPRVVLRTRTQVWQAEPGGDGHRLWLDGPDGGTTVGSRAVVVATGATELVLPFPGWDLPGVMTAGAAQALVKAHGVLPGRRVLVAGSGPLLLPVAATLARAGATVAVAEAVPPRRWAAGAVDLAAHPAKAAEAGGYLATLARHGVPLWLGHAVAECAGDGVVERVRLRRRGHGPETDRWIGVDAVCVSHGFVPALELPRALGCALRTHRSLPAAGVVCDAEQATTVPGAFAAGETTGVAGAAAAAAEGTIAGAAAARFAGRRAAPPPAHVRGRRARAARFAEQLERRFPVDEGWLTRLRDDTPVCRCEEVPWSAIRAAVRGGAADVRAVKGVTRCGMGYCQGRVCGPPLQLALHALTNRPLEALGDLQSRTIAVPVRLDAVARGG